MSPWPFLALPARARTHAQAYACSRPSLLTGPSRPLVGEHAYGARCTTFGAPWRHAPFNVTLATALATAVQSTSSMKMGWCLWAAVQGNNRQWPSSSFIPLCLNSKARLYLRGLFLAQGKVNLEQAARRRHLRASPRSGWERAWPPPPRRWRPRNSAACVRGRHHRVGGGHVAPGGLPAAAHWLVA